MPVKDEAAKNITLLIKIEEENKTNKETSTIFIDDGSTDKSWEVIKSSKFKNKNYKIDGIKLIKNYGKDIALYSGLERINSKFMVFMIVICNFK